MRDLILWYVRGAPLQLAAASALGALSGLFGAALIALISQGLAAGGAEAGQITPHLLGYAVGLVLLVVGAELLTKWLHLRIHLTRFNQLREEIVRRLFATELARVEQIGPAAVYSALVDDVRSILVALLTLPNVAISSAVLIGCASYLLWLSPAMLLILGGVAIPILGVILLLNRFARAWYMTYLRGRDAQLANFMTATEGIRELKLGVGKQEVLLDGRIRPTAEAMRRAQLRAEMWFATGSAATQLMYLLAILAAFLLVAGDWIPRDVLASYALTTIFMKEHVGRLVSAYPAWSQAATAHAKFSQLGLSAAVGGGGGMGRVEAVPAAAAVAVPGRIRIRQARYRYAGADAADTFEVGPIDCDFSPGEVVFIVGENGGGKSTFAKLLAGLYFPDSGEIRMDGQLLRPDGAQAYREHFSVVFTDSFVFEQLPVAVGTGQGERIAHLLRRLELDQKVSVDENALSTTRLSHGQRKRLALLHAILEDRPVMIFDEWAATQDPRFKQFFYLELLPELKAQGKLVVAITHDIEFAAGADRVLEMEYGRLSVVRG